MVHIRCGDDVLRKLPAAGIRGDRVRWTEMLSEGPLPGHLSETAFRKQRAAYLARRLHAPAMQIHRELMVQDERVDDVARYDEAVLWFEHDLFDQSLLVALLARLQRTAPEANLSLISTDRYQGVARFVGLGQLTPAQLATLVPTRRPVTRRMFELARLSWDAFRAPTPWPLQRLARMRVRALPYLPRAIQRYLEEYPAVGDGLSRTERQALRAIRDGARTPREAFPAAQAMEERPFMGDALFFAVVQDLAAGAYPLVRGGYRRFPELRGERLPRTPLALTDLGRKVVDGELDWWPLRGMPKWMGGVHLDAPWPAWRWSRRAGRIVPVKQPPSRRGRY